MSQNYSALHIGGGAILKRADRAHGTATAASLWVTGAVGAAVGYGLYDIAAILAAVTFATLRAMAPLKGSPRPGSATHGAAGPGAEGEGDGDPKGG